MRIPGRWVLLGVSSAILLASGLWAQNPPAGQDQSNKDKNGQAQQAPPKRLTKAQQKKAMSELGNAYKGWLENEVLYIITDAEREAFLSLSTNEDRESFIEQFWLRRNPNPDTIENEFKEEHYRRIAYANEHYASGIPGWKTDRGHIYILWGKPDSVETHPSGGTYNRTPEEGGGETSTYPFETWTYHYLEGIGPNIELEFVDKSGSNEYHLSTDPEEKDALLYVPGAGLSELESMGFADKNSRFNRSDGTHMPIGSNYAPGYDEFSRYELMAKVFVPPPAKSKDLEALVSARIVRNQLPFDYNFAFLRITTESVMVPITIELPNREMTFQEKDGVHSATASGHGPVHALDLCLRKCLASLYPRISDVRLTDYKVRVLEPKKGTAARVRVLVEWSDHRKSWSTVGVSDNVIEASWSALVDAIRLELMRLTEQDESVEKAVEDYCWGV